jgi:signal transduction histidine kinase
MNNASTKLFSRATLKLTMVYTSIIFAVSLFFSFIVWSSSLHAIDQPFNRMPNVVIYQDNSADSFAQISHERMSQVNSEILLGLIFANIGILIFGLLGSFLLAHWTLRPIRRAMTEQSDFIANASHELKTPLAVIQTENEVTLREKKPKASELRETLVGNLSEIKKLRKLTEYLLAMNSAENSSVKLSETDLIEVLREPISRISGKAEHKKITISRKISPIKITTNAENLAEIIYILLDNAVKYSPENTQISLVASAHEISVSDQGSGVPDEDISRIFERFYRSEKSHTSEGFGLGLSLASSLAEKIHAKISVENLRENDKIVGAKFVVKL